MNQIDVKNDTPSIQHFYNLELWILFYTDKMHNMERHMHNVSGSLIAVLPLENFEKHPT